MSRRKPTPEALVLQTAAEAAFSARLALAVHKAPRVALVGRPNVGKSTLFNLLAKGERWERKAVVHATAGTTRDVRMVPGRLFGLMCRLLDTAGIEPAQKGKTQSAPGHAGFENLQEELNRRSIKAAEQADVLVFVLDGAVGVTPADRELARLIRKMDKPVVPVLNKGDLKAAESFLDDVERLGFGTPVLMTAAHSGGLDDLYDALKAHLPEAPELEEEPEEEAVAEGDEDLMPVIVDDEDVPMVEVDASVQEVLPEVISLAILGRPNVGKSTLVNTLLHEEVMLTGPVAGLTREAIGHSFSRSGQQYKVVDTPGLRRKNKIDEEIEGLSVAQALAAADSADAVVLVVDVSGYSTAKGTWTLFEQQDAKIAAAILAKGKPIVVALNKYDAVREKTECLDDVAAQLRARLHDIPQVLAMPISALKNKGLGDVLDAVKQVLTANVSKTGTAKLNRTLAKILAKRSPPLAQGHSVNLKYITQVAIKPPVFAIFGNRVHLLPDHYKQFMKHQLAEALGLQHVPLRLIFKRGKNPFKDIYRAGKRPEKPTPKP